MLQCEDPRRKKKSRVFSFCLITLLLFSFVRGGTCSHNDAASVLSLNACLLLLLDLDLNPEVETLEAVRESDAGGPP
jgi:hypothetical protein